jgi:hypothetical protein
MDDAAYFRDHAERYRKLAAAFSDRPISARLARLAEEFDVEARNLPRQRACAIRCAPALRPFARMQGATWERTTPDV